MLPTSVYTDQFSVPSFQSELERLQQLWQLSRYSEANAGLERLRERVSADMNKNAIVASELAYMYFRQGYCKKSASVLDEWLDTHPGASDQLESSVLALVQLTRELARIHGGKVEASLEVCKGVFSDVLAPFYRDLLALEYDRTMVRTATLHERIIISAVSFWVLPKDSMYPKSLRRLERLFDHLSRAREYGELGNMLGAFMRVTSWPENVEFCQRLIDDSQFPTIAKIQAQYEAGCIFLAQLGYNHIWGGYFKAAREGAKEISHSSIELDLRSQQLGQRISNSSEGNLELDASILKDLAELNHAYESLDWPIQQLVVLQNTFRAADALGDFDTVNQVLRQAADLSDILGSNLLLIVAQLSLLSTFVKRTGHTAKVIEFGEALLESAEQIKAPVGLRAMLLTVLATAHGAVGQHVEAFQYLMKAGTLSSSAATVQTAADPLLEQLRSLSLSSEDAMRKLENMSQKFITQEHWVEAAERLLALSELEYEQMHISQSKSTLDKVIVVCSSVESEFERSLLLARARVSSALHYRAWESTHEGGAQHSLAAIEDLEAALDVFTKYNDLPRIITNLPQLGLAYMRLYHKTHTPSDLSAARGALERAYELAATNRHTHMSILSSHSLSLCLLEQLKLNAYSISECRKLLGRLTLTEKCMNERRHELSSLPILDAITTKQALSSDTAASFLYKTAIDICHRCGWTQKAWDWMQKRKARSVSDMLGLGVIIPQALLADVEKDKAASELLQKDSQLRSFIASLPQGKRLTFRKSLDEVQTQMRESLVLREVMALREGDTTTLAQLQHCLDSKSISGGLNTLLVDWAAYRDSGMLMLFVSDHRKGSPPQCFPLGVTQGEIEDWRREYFADDEIREETLLEDEEDSPLRELDVLVEPLGRCTKPGDRLIFSPTGPLHSLPLHALWIQCDEEPILLIERNPVVYSPNATILEQSLVRARARHESCELGSPTIFAVYNSQSEDAVTDVRLEQTLIYENADRVAGKIGGSVFKGAEVTKKSFAKECTKSPLIHFHGHCHFDVDDILRQSLILNQPIEGNEDYKDNSALPRGVESTELTVKDILAMRLPNNCVVLMACESASQEFSIGDEPLGILTALMVAGAASVLGTLWPIRTREGRQFSEDFYQGLAAQKGDDTPIYLDYAAALRKGVLEARERRDSRQPLFWASYTLSGSWIGKTF